MLPPKRRTLPESQGTANIEAEMSVTLYEITRSQVTVKLEATASSETSIFMYQTMRDLGAVNIETAGLTQMLVSI